MRTRNTRTMVAAGTLAAALMLTACTGNVTPSTSPSADADAAAGVATLKPLDEAALVATFEEMAEDMGQPGAALLIRTPEGDFTATYGTVGPDSTTPVSIDDHIRVGSNTKTWTGTVILQLVEEGKIAVDDPVSKYRPDVPNGENITIDQMLKMRSGLGNYTETLELNVALDQEPERVWQPEEVVAMGLALEPDFEPGTAYHYSNTNTVLLGLIAEKIENKPLSDIFQERLFDPLGLTETSFPAIEDASLPEPYSRGYFWWDNEHTTASSLIPADLRTQAAEGTFLPHDVTLNNPSWGWSAGSGISTAEDLADWVEALAGKDGGVLTPEMQAARMDSLEAISPAPGAPRYGWNIGEFGQFYGHSGELPGFNSFMAHDPVADVTVVVWSNLAPASMGVGPAAEIARQLIADMYTKVS